MRAQRRAFDPRWTTIVALGEPRRIKEVRMTVAAHERDVLVIHGGGAGLASNTTAADGGRVSLH